MKVPATSNVRLSRGQERRKLRRKKKVEHLPPVLDVNSTTTNTSAAFNIGYYEASCNRQRSLKKLTHRQSRKVFFSSAVDEKPQQDTSRSIQRRTHAHTNGATGEKSPVFIYPCLDYEVTTEEDDTYWHSFAESIQNGVVEQDGNHLSVDDQTDGDASEVTLPYLAATADRNQRTVVVMAPGQILKFTGKCQLTCLYGRVEVFGFTIEEGQPSYPLFSPASHCALSIKSLQHPTGGKTKKERRLEAKSIVKNYLSLGLRQNLLKTVTSETTLILLEPLDSPVVRFICSLPQYKNLFKPIMKEDCSVYLRKPECPLSTVGVTILPDDSGLVMSETYTAAVSDLIKACLEEEVGCPVILVCGGRNVGKSTFNRFLINSLLNHIPCLEYLECDLGQTEFTPSGCLSLHSVSEPLLGPPFTHQHSPQQMVYFGEASCEKDLDRYLESVKYLLSFYRRETPLIVNTMGWVKEFGLMLLIDLIRLLSVTHVVQLSNGDVQQMPNLTAAYIGTAPGWHTKGHVHRATDLANLEMLEDADVPRGHKLLCVQSQFSAIITRYASNVLRDLALLGYFSQLQSADPGPVIPLHCFTPYQVPMASVALRVLHCHVAPNHIMYTANASFVGLCSVAEGVSSSGKVGSPVLLSHTPVCDCLGFGILRGVDAEKGLYYIVTPLAPSKLRNVNCLLVGSVVLPHSVFKSQAGTKDMTPYVTSDYLFTVFGAGKVKVNKSIKRREHLHSSFGNNSR
ncbi:polynucleotide 5'-hydroxyl-kinase NOL9 [Erpetoichthys calabaricus]|uniref:Polynucleotide 5'-hydroxyl-kinase NOL9 n=1 Tax=Erpetoichthys calabaricus TaxID=27687 RepID=A0A8C4X6U3_ERPCA|nr:polynucleotide 5'-hydroxyl-kinase NOL9 [Erpetoichthys calabaricus]XP_051786387.1 polynucleotide 5'-hydroxyl-kinase NOL9 [Erpetoichthys calabaricus]